MQALPANAVLIIIDVQKGFDSPYWGVRNNPEAEENIKTLLNLWRKTARPVIHVRHMSTEPNSPLHPDAEGNEFKSFAAPIDGERIEEKTVNSAFIGTGLDEYLRRGKFDTIVIVGLTTDHCVSTSTRMAGNLGYNTFLVADATATFDRTGHDGAHYPAEGVHAYALASLHDEFATVVKTEEVLKACLLVESSAN